MNKLLAFAWYVFVMLYCIWVDNHWDTMTFAKEHPIWFEFVMIVLVCALVIPIGKIMKTDFSEKKE